MRASRIQLFFHRYNIDSVFWDSLSIRSNGLNTFILFVSMIYPFITISSNKKCTCSNWYMISSSHILPAHLSIVSTKLWMNSNNPNSFSGLSFPSSLSRLPTMKKRLCCCLVLFLFVQGEWDEFFLTLDSIIVNITEHFSQWIGESQ